MRVSTLLIAFSGVTTVLLPSLLALPTEYTLAVRQISPLITLYQNMNDAIVLANQDPTVESLFSILDYISYEINLMNIDPIAVVGPSRFFGPDDVVVDPPPGEVEPALVFASSPKSTSTKALPAAPSSTHVIAPKPPTSPSVSAKVLKVASVSLSIGQKSSSTLHSSSTSRLFRSMSSSDGSPTSIAPFSSTHPAIPSSRPVPRWDGDPVINMAYTAAFELIDLGHNMPSKGSMLAIYLDTISAFLQLAYVLDPYVEDLFQQMRLTFPNEI